MLKGARRLLRLAGESVLSRRRRAKYAWVPWWAPVRIEADLYAHASAERADLFEALNAGTTEYEVLNWLHATVMALKPENVLETGAYEGFGTMALASACRSNGFGTVHSVEIVPAHCLAVARRLRAAGLSRFAEMHCESSLDFLATTPLVFDIGFFDSSMEIRAQEFRIALERGAIRTAAIFHDTSPLRYLDTPNSSEAMQHAKMRSELLALARGPRCSGYFESKLSRGFIAIFLQFDAAAALGQS
jgi:predicted O-methyltransferase YrrM